MDLKNRIEHPCIYLTSICIKLQAGAQVFCLVLVPAPQLLVVSCGMVCEVKIDADITHQ